MNTYNCLKTLCESLNLNFYEIPEHSDQALDIMLSESEQLQTGEENWQPFFKKYPLYDKENPKYGKSTSKDVKKLWESRDEEYRKSFGEKISKTMKENKCGVGEKNSMYGRSAVSENNLKWYNDGERNIYVTEDTQPTGFSRGRIVKWKTR